VLPGQDPGGDRLDVVLGAPAEELLELRHARLVARAVVGEALGPGVAAVAVEDDADVSGPSVGGDAGGEAALVRLVERAGPPGRHRRIMPVADQVRGARRSRSSVFSTLPLALSGR